MVQFGSGYYMPMDREYARPNVDSRSTNDVGVGIGDVGVSLGLGPVPNIPGVGAKMRAGTKTIELGFFGMDKGSQQGHTPEMYGKLQRQALREMQAANRVDFTTHSTVGVQGLAGMDRQGNFSRRSKEASLDEIKRAIDFAADVGQGGPVVVHTGEFMRPLYDSEWNKEGEFKNKFQMYEGEAERASFYVVDSRTGGLILEARKNKAVARPVWKRYEEKDEFWKEKSGREYEDSKGHKVKPGDYIDEYGNYLPPESRVPRFNKEKGIFETHTLGWKELENEAVEMTQRAREEFQKWKKGQLSENEVKKSLWGRFLKPELREEDILVKPEEAYIISTLETNAANSRGWAYYYSGQFGETIEQVKKLKKALEFYEKLESTANPEEKWKLQQQAHQYSQFVPPETKYPSEIIKQQLERMELEIKRAQEGSSSQWAQAEENMETIRHVESADSYAKKEAYDAYAQAGIQAMLRSNQLEKKQALKRPIAVAMENLFPESYGSHPDELMDLVEKSREKMKQELVKKYHLSQDQAEKKAQDHLVATFDTGHLNMWRKYWKDNPNKSIEQNDSDFKKWTLTKVEELAKRKIVGHLHLVDNYGYQDDHLAPGEGNTPVKEIVEIFKKYGYKGELIVEPGADYSTDSSGFSSVTKTWKLFGSPVYGAGWGAAPKSWGEVGYGYFGQAQPPYYVVGEYVPSEDWTLWSGTRLE